MTPGTILGRYEVISLIGKGAMGEVYRAIDTKIKRHVAIKVLPSAFSLNPERLRRFELEAQTAGSLNHPNILTVYDVGAHEGAPYIVSELLEGQTLRERLTEKPLPLEKSVSLALQLAQGLTSAHDKGITHRDLKPENIFITNDDRVKILDFGLAKLLSTESLDDADTHAPTSAPNTMAGMILGTAGYMSPEQVRGESSAVDHRSDIFSFGAVLFEMLAGTRAFVGGSAVETMNAILTTDPLQLIAGNSTIHMAIKRFLGHCLEKSPMNRFQSARDLVFDLERLCETYSGSSSFRLEKPPPDNRRRRTIAIAIAIASLTLAGALAIYYFLAPMMRGASPATYSQVSFRRGTIFSARFTPDENSIVYTASFDGSAPDVFSTRKDSPESRSLELPNCTVLSVSSTGEMAILSNGQHLGHFTHRGVLGRMPLTGSTPRQLFGDVQEADWAADGSELVIVRHAGERDRLEYPPNNVLYETTGWISNVRMSPKGDRIAFVPHTAQWDNRGQITIVTTDGTRNTLSEEWSSIDGLAWSPDGEEIWFTAKKQGEAAALYAVSLKNKLRVVQRAPAHLRLHDISKSGRVLLSRGYDRSDFIGLSVQENRERNLSWLDRGLVRDLSTDGKTFIFTYWGEKSGPNYTTYLRKTDGSAAIPLGEGAGWAISPDDQYVLSMLSTPLSRMVLLPTGVGDRKQLDRFSIVQYGLGASWLPDGKNVIFIGRQANEGMRTYLQNLNGDPPRAVTPEGFLGTSVSPDGKFLVVADTKQKKYIYSLAGDSQRQLDKVKSAEQVIRWAKDSRTLYVYNPTEIPLKIYEFDLEAGARKLTWELTPADQTGILGPIQVFLTPDGKGYIYNFRRYLSDLYLVEELK